MLVAALARSSGRRPDTFRDLQQRLVDPALVCETVSTEARRSTPPMTRIVLVLPKPGGPQMKAA